MLLLEFLFLCVQNGGRGLDCMDRRLCKVSQRSNSYLFRIPVFSPKPPRGAEGSQHCAGSGFRDSDLVSPLPSLTYDLEANHLSASWPFPQLEHSHSASVHECELN